MSLRLHFMISHFALKGPKWRKTTSVLAQHFSWQFSWPPWCQPLSLHFVIYHFCINNTLRRFNETPNDFGHIRSMLVLFIDKHQTCKRGTLFAQEKKSGPAGLSSRTARHLVLLRGSNYSENFTMRIKILWLILLWGWIYSDSFYKDKITRD